MAVTAADLATAVGVDVARATALLGVVTALVDRYAPDAPVAVKDEATIRCAGWLAQAPRGGQRREDQGDISTSYTPASTGALRSSGAMSLLSPWKIRNAGTIG